MTGVQIFANSSSKHIAMVRPSSWFGTGPSRWYSVRLLCRTTCARLLFDITILRFDDANNHSDIDSWIGEDTRFRLASDTETAEQKKLIECKECACYVITRLQRRVARLTVSLRCSLSTFRLGYIDLLETKLMLL